ncbi:DUF1109 domain-containing protein [Devosia rhodophyticola]|uniref:DUF1109 domain-containing protein n=1 Tax=Devosia rhodophyticola TaxID=3026423 RepID=A0ABY7YUN1_9HYPH|nr:DUF1109 domain-containing protein [Devosia rhodophyticola]WDR05021.1 DUF1109 domain-containing protein [Devosia rhodophyticola]
MTDELIARLSNNLKPVPHNAVQLMILGALAIGGVVAVSALLMELGFRADIDVAMLGPVFWIKSAYTMAIAVLGGVLTLTLVRPEGRIKWPWFAAPILVLILALGAATQLMGTDQQTAMVYILGGSALVCPWLIVALSSPILATLLVAMRRLAPANPTLAGLAAGMLAGGPGRGFIRSTVAKTAWHSF